MDPETDPTVPITVFAVPFPDPQPDGIQGWSLAVSHDRSLIGFDPDGGAPTTSGTDAESLFSGGFRKTEEVKGGGQGGFVSAVVLSFTEPAILDPTRAQSLARARYKVNEAFSAMEVESTLIQFKDGLRGSGQPIQRVNLEVRRGITTAPFIRGDANEDRKVHIGDAIWCVNDLVRSGPSPACRLASDINADDFFDLADPLYLILWQFLAGPSIPPPYPACGRAVGSPFLECPAGAVRYCDG